MKRIAILAVTCIIGSGAVSAYAEFDPAMCSGYEEAAKWSQEQDALSAAPNNHRVIFENEEIRVLEVTVQPGERENLHHHRWPSAMIVDSRPKYVNYDKDGNEIKPAVRAPGNPVMPIMVRLPGTARSIASSTWVCRTRQNIPFRDPKTQPIHNRLGISGPPGYQP